MAEEQKKREYWNYIEIANIDSFSGVAGGSNGGRFTITMKDGHKHSFHYQDLSTIYQKLYEVRKLFNEYHNVPESYEIKCNTYIEVNGGSEHFGYKVDTNTGETIHITKLQAAEFKKQCKLIDDGSRWAVYSSVGVIQFGKIIRGKVDDDFIAQLKDLGYDFPIEKELYKNGQKVEEVN